MIRVHLRDKGSDRNLLLYYIDPQTGREVSRSAKTRARDEALKAAARWEDELKQHRGTDGDSWLYFRERFEDEHLVTLKPKTQKTFATALNTFERYVKVERLNAVTNSTISTYRSKLIRDGYPLTTVATYLTHLRAALNWAEEIAQMIDRAPHVSLPTIPSRDLMRGRPITWREMGKLLRACRAIHGAEAGQWRRFLKLLWYSGLRIGEACQLSWDRRPYKVRIDGKPYPHIEFYAEVSTSSQPGHKAGVDMTVPLTPEFAAWLERTPTADRRGLVAPVLNGADNQMNAEKLSLRVSEIGVKSGVVIDEEEGEAQHPTAHDIRRSFGTRWAQKVRPITLQRMMRHKDIKTTLKYYVSLNAADAGAELWGPIVPRKVPNVS